MAVKFPGVSGNYLSLQSALSTAGATIFARIRLPSVPADGAMPLGLTTSNTSARNNMGGSYALGNQLHGFVLEPNGDGYDINEMGYWGSFLGPIVSGLAVGQLVKIAITLYSANSRPAIKFSIKPEGGTLSTRVRNDSFWTTANVIDTFTNALILLGAGLGGANPANILASDVFMYPAAITADADIEEQMDSLEAAHESPYFVTSLRGYATVSAAAAKESGSAVPAAWSVNGTGITIDNSLDGSAGVALTGGGTLGITDSESAPATPSDLATGAATATTIALTWTPVSGATSYTIYGRDITAEEGSWEPYQQVLGQSSSAVTIQDLQPRTEYGFKIAATNGAGTSVLSDEVSESTKNLRVRCRARPSAAGVTGVAVTLWRLPQTSGDFGEKIGTFKDLSFEPSTVVDGDGKTVAEIFVEIIQQAEPVAAGDLLHAIAETATKTTPRILTAVVQEV